MVTTDTTEIENGKPRKVGKAGKEGKGKGAGGRGRESRHEATSKTADDVGRGGDGVTSDSAPIRARATRAAVKVGAVAAGRRIRGIAELSESLDVRRRLRRLARQVERRSQDVQHMAFIEGAICDCLEDATATPVERERWLLCEAATWGLAWMARTRRAGGSAGGLLERLVKESRAAQAGLSSGDTRSARFVLAVSRLFSDIEACRCQEPGAAAALAAEIGRLGSDAGTIGLQGSVAMVERVVHWSLARDIALATGGPAWDADTEKRFEKAVATTLRLLGAQGRLLLGAGRMPAAFTDPLLAVAVASPRKRVRRTAESVQAAAGGDRSASAGGKGGVKAAKLLPRDLHDAQASVAIMRSGWDRGAIRVLLDYHGAVPSLEIAAGDRLLVAGEWRLSVSRGGRPLEVEGPWKLSCWESDRRATYIEIVAPLSGGLQIDRQVVLLPEDRIVFLADAVTVAEADTPATTTARLEAVAASGRLHPDGELRVESVVPLAASLDGDGADETREILVSDTKPRLLALPLALPEWKTAGRGTFTAGSEGLSLTHQAAGGRCYSPLWLDLDPSRQGRQLTWRQLTVADTRQNLPPYQAVGFRIQVGLEQWLVYRTLDESRNRTVLGCNIASEFVIGRIEHSGVVKRTIEIL